MSGAVPSSGTSRTELRVPRGHVLGLDLSGPMPAEARGRAEREGITNASFVQGATQVYPFGEGSFDAAVSRYGVMFFADPVAASGNVGRALRPGGRLAFVCPADAPLNGWIAAMGSLRDLLPVGDFGRPGLPGMFSLAAPDRIRELLAAAGFTGIGIDQRQSYGTWGQGAEDAAAFLLGTGPGRHLMEQADAATRSRARQILTDQLRAQEVADGTVRLLSTSWLVTADPPADPSIAEGA